MYGFLGKVGAKTSRTSNEPIQYFDGKSQLKQQQKNMHQIGFESYTLSPMERSFQESEPIATRNKKRAKQIFHVL